MLIRGALFSVACLTAAAATAASPTVRSVASSELWRGEPGVWAWRDGTVTGRSLKLSYAAVRDRTVSRSVVIEAQATPKAIVGENWKGVGVAVYLDARNLWLLSLGEFPNAKERTHYAALTEMRDGKWHAQKSLKEAVSEGSGQWELGQTYHFRLELTPERVEGAIRDSAGVVLLRRAFLLGNEGVSAGRPALRVDGIEAAFTELRTGLGAPAPGPADIAYPPFRSAPAMAGITSRATGYFRVEQIDDRWWVIDPDGAATLGLAVDHVKYSGPWCAALNKFEYKENNEATYGSRGKWEEQTLRRLQDWGFNLVPIGGDHSLRGRGLAHGIYLTMGYRFALLGDTHEITPYRGRPGTVFPNVFHPDFPAWLDYYAAETCAPLASDPWLFGYFLDNELAWGGKHHGVWHGMFDAMLLKSADHTGKIALRDHLRDEYGTVAKLNRAWGTDVTSWDDILSHKALGNNDKPEVLRVKAAFLDKAAELYFRLTSAAIRRHDPNHMVIGCRLAAGLASEGMWRSCGKYCDIVSFNYYGSVNLETKSARSDFRDNMGTPLTDVFTRFYQQCGRPLLNSEWAFVALDAGLPCTKGAGQRFRTQAERAAAIEITLTAMLRMPFMIGSAVFKHIDQPALGVRAEFPEDSNYGLVNVNDEPYKEVTEAFTRVHSRAAELHTMGPVEEKPDPSGGFPADWLLRDASAERTPELPLSFERQGKGFVASNGRIRIESADGTGALTDRISIDGLELGHCNAMIRVVAEKQQWRGANRLESVHVQTGTNGMELDLVGSWGKAEAGNPTSQPFEICHRVTLFPDRPWAVARLGWVRNLSDRPLRMHSVYFRAPSAIRGDASDDTPTEASKVPRLWKGNGRAAWLDPQGGFLGLVGPADGRVNVRFRVDERGVQHANAIANCNVTIPTGDTWRPARPTWVVIAAGTGGLAEWETLSRKVAR